MEAGQQEARVAAVDLLRAHANQVMLGRRSHIEVSHLDALRIVDLVREITEDRDRLRLDAKGLWKRMDALEAHIERLGSNVEAAFAEAASVDTHPKGGDSTQIEAPLVSGAVPHEDEADAQPHSGEI